MFTNQEAKYLLDLEKTLAIPDRIVYLKNKRNTLELISPYDTDYTFRLDITTNQKIILKTSIHHMESKSYVGLLRIDFKGGHHNPSEILESLPEFLIPFADKWFDPSKPHMHFYVEGYKPLAWAIPLEATDFPIKDITHQSDLNELITNFANKINLKSKINIQQSIV